MQRGLLKGRVRRAGALVAIVAGVAGVATATAGTASSVAASKSPFTYVMVNDTSGPASVYGKQDAAAMQAAVNYINPKGGIGGHPVKLVMLNDNGDSNTGITVLDSYLTSHPKPNAVFPGTSGFDSAGVCALMTRDHLLGMGVDNCGGTLGGPCQTICPTTYTPGDQPSVAAGTLAQWFKKNGHHKIGVLLEQDAFNQSELAPFQAAATAAGLTTTVANFAPTAVDVKPQWSQLKAAGVDAVYVCTLGPGVGYAAAGRAQLGLAATVPVVWDLASASQDLTKVAPANELGNSWEEIPSSENPKVKMPGRTLLLKYIASTGGITDPMIVASFEWQDIITLHDAALQAGSIATDKLVKALNNLAPKYQTDPLNMEATKIKFTPQVHLNTGGNPSTDYSVVRTGPLVNGMVTGKV